MSGDATPTDTETATGGSECTDQSAGTEPVDGIDPSADTVPSDGNYPADAPECPCCGDAFPTERLRDLHRGLEHYEHLDEDERAVYEAAYRSESEDLRSFRLRALAVLVLLYFGFLMTYAVVAV